MTTLRLVQYKLSALLDLPASQYTPIYLVLQDPTAEGKLSHCLTPSSMPALYLEYASLPSLISPPCIIQPCTMFRVIFWNTILCYHPLPEYTLSGELKKYTLSGPNNNLELILCFRSKLTCPSSLQTPFLLANCTQFSCLYCAPYPERLPSISSSQKTIHLL